MMRMMFVAAILFATLTSITALEAGERLSYRVTRDGDEIGTHSIEFSSTPDGNLPQVDIMTDINVKILGFSVYNFKHNAQEVWRNGYLDSYESISDDDGTEKYLTVSISGTGLSVEGSAGNRLVRADIFPASLWDKRTIEQNVLLNTLDGSLMTVTVDDLGEETVRNEIVHHYAVTGGLERELWYNRSGELRKVRFQGDDGSIIEYNPVDE